MLLLQRLVCARVLLVVRTRSALDLGLLGRGRALPRVGVSRGRRGEGVPAFVTELRQDTASVIRGRALDRNCHPILGSEFDNATLDPNRAVHVSGAHHSAIITDDQIEAVIDDHAALIEFAEVVRVEVVRMGCIRCLRDVQGSTGDEGVIICSNKYGSGIEVSQLEAE